MNGLHTQTGTRNRVSLYRLVRLACRWAHRREWEYGMCHGRRARRNRKSGAVQFVLWKGGEQGHRFDYWHDFDSSWWPLFLPNASGEPHGPSTK
jgi:hypothetical protein